MKKSQLIKTLTLMLNEGKMSAFDADSRFAFPLSITQIQSN